MSGKVGDSFPDIALETPDGGSVGVGIGVGLGLGCATGLTMLTGLGASCLTGCCLGGSGCLIG